MAAALVISLGSEPQDVFNVLHNLITVRGRMELAASRANGAVYLSITPILRMQLRLQLNR